MTPEQHLAVENAALKTAKDNYELAIAKLKTEVKELLLAPDDEGDAISHKIEAKVKEIGTARSIYLTTVMKIKMKSLHRENMAFVKNMQKKADELSRSLKV